MINSYMKYLDEGGRFADFSHRVIPGLSNVGAVDTGDVSSGTRVEDTSGVSVVVNSTPIVDVAGVVFSTVESVFSTLATTANSVAGSIGYQIVRLSEAAEGIVMAPSDIPRQVSDVLGELRTIGREGFKWSSGLELEKGALEAKARNVVGTLIKGLSSRDIRPTTDVVNDAIEILDYAYARQNSLPGADPAINMMELFNLEYTLLLLRKSSMVTGESNQTEIIGRLTGIVDQFEDYFNDNNHAMKVPLTDEFGINEIPGNGVDYFILEGFPQKNFQERVLPIRLLFRDGRNMFRCNNSINNPESQAYEVLNERLSGPSYVVLDKRTIDEKRRELLLRGWTPPNET
ncbi:hypothetical protein HOH87_05235 [bacterium]|jgi:hypothetical protein|nr:hypothetical protein [bacterium]